MPARTSVGMHTACFFRLLISITLVLCQRVPDYRLKWLGPGREVSVSGDWDSWSRPGIQMRRDEGGSFAADIYLPEECPRNNLVMSGVCCFHYKFFVSFATGFSRWLHDPKQPMDKDPDGWVNNFMCKYARTHDGQLQKSDVAQRTIASGQQLVDAKDGQKAGKGAAQDSSDADVVPAEHPACLLLPATYFNGSTLRTTSTRVMHGCCEACRRQPGCVAFNWRAEPLPRNCVMLDKNYGIARGTALSSAGTISLSPLLTAIGNGNALQPQVSKKPTKVPQVPPNRYKKRKRQHWKKKPKSEDSSQP